MKKTTQEFKAFKESALNNEPLMRTANLIDVTIINDKTISFQGKELKCTDGAMNDFSSIVGMPKTFSNSITGAFGAETTQRISELQKAAKVMKGKNPQITLIYNKKFGVVEGISSNSSMLPYNMYFDVFDRMMNGTNMEITDFGHSDMGGLSISTVSRESEFHVGNFKDEIFHPGLAFINNVRNGASLESYINRLVCSNGSVHSEGKAGFIYNPESMDEFFKHIQGLKATGFLPAEFKAKVALAIATRASYSEVKSAANMITSCSTLEKQFVDQFIPFNDIRRKFAAKGADTLNWNAAQEKNAITNISVWDVINGVTDFASHDYGFGVSADNKLNLQVKAGSMLSTKSYDTQNLVHVSL